MGGVLVDKEGVVPLLHQNIGAVQLAYHPPGVRLGHFQSGLLHFRFRCFHGRFRRRRLRRFRQRGQGRGRLRLDSLTNLGQHDKLPQGHVSTGGNFLRRCRGGFRLGLGSVGHGGGEGLVLLGGHGAEKSVLLFGGFRFRNRGRFFRRQGGRLGLELNGGPVRLFVQGSQHAIVDAVENRLFREKFYLGFCRMDVYVHGVGGKIQVKHTAGKPPHHQLIPVGFLQCRNEQLGFDRPVVDKKGL